MSDGRPIVLVGQPLLAPLLKILSPFYDARPLWRIKVPNGGPMPRP